MGGSFAERGQSLRRHLYETHLPVADTKVAEKVYREIVGLPFAYRDPSRDIVFLWVDAKQKAMIGLWGPNTAYGKQTGIAQKCHVAFAVSLAELFAAIEKLNANNIETLGFDGNKSSEPTVIGWMQSAQIYFLDPGCLLHEISGSLADPPN